MGAAVGLLPSIVKHCTCLWLIVAPENNVRVYGCSYLLLNQSLTPDMLLQLMDDPGDWEEGVFSILSGTLT